MTLLFVLLALRKLAPRPDLTLAWAAWWLTVLIVLLVLLGMLAPGGDPPLAVPEPTPEPATTP